MYNLPTFRLDALVILGAKGWLEHLVEMSASCTPKTKLSAKNLCCFYTATATEKDVTSLKMMFLFPCSCRESPKFTLVQRLRQIHLFFTDYPRWFSRRMSSSLNTRPKACYPQSFEVWHQSYPFVCCNYYVVYWQIAFHTHVYMYHIHFSIIVAYNICTFMQ